MERPEPDMSAHDSLLEDRIIAWLIDSVLMTIFALLLTGGLFAATVNPSGGDSEELLGSIFLALIVGAFLFTLISFVYPIIMEAKYGQTFGKMVTDIVVVKEDGSPCDMTASILRNILRIVDQQPSFYILGIALIYATDEHQRVGDMVAETIVTKKRRGKPRGRNQRRTTERREYP